MGRKNRSKKYNRSTYGSMTNSGHYKQINIDQDNAMRNESTRFGMNPKNLEIPRRMFRLGDLKLGVGFQRPVNPVRVKKIVDSFDPVKARGILVAKINNDWWVVDGQHRVSALLQLEDYGPDALISCEYFEGMTYQEAAYYFSHQDDNKVRISNYDRLKADYESGNANAIEIINTLNEFGVTAKAGKASKNNITAIATLNGCYRDLGSTEFKRLIRIISSSFEDDDKRFSDEILKGTKLFLMEYGGLPEFSAERLINKMNAPNAFIYAYKQAQIIDGDVKMTKAMKFKKYLVMNYNKNLHGGRLVWVDPINGTMKEGET